jgi:hypothetical protein
MNLRKSVERILRILKLTDALVKLLKNKHNDINFEKAFRDSQSYRSMYLGKYKNTYLKLIKNICS